MLGLGGKGDTAVKGPIRGGNSKTHAYRVPISNNVVRITVRPHKSFDIYRKDSPDPG